MIAFKMKFKASKVNKNWWRTVFYVKYFVYDSVQKQKFLIIGFNVESTLKISQRMKLEGIIKLTNFRRYLGNSNFIIYSFFKLRNQRVK